MSYLDANDMIREQEQFLKYIRTKMIFSLRLRSETDEMKPVYLKSEEIKRFLKNNSQNQIKALIDRGDLEVTKSGDWYYYKVLKPGGFDLSLIETKPIPSDRIFQTMSGHLKNVDMKPGTDRTEYFDLFLKYKTKAIKLFFKVDEFAGRLYTPVTTQHRIHRPNLLLYGKETTGLDVQTMQPLLLGKILKNEIGNNDFSQWLNNGMDIYVMLQDKAGLNTRDEAKKRFFEILFSFPNKDLASMFGDANWINWINDYKSKPEPRNNKVKYLENGKISYHNNLAWLLQSTEVKTMRKVWNALEMAKIPFLSVHDEIIIQKENRDEALKIFSSIMEKEFEYFKISCKATDQEQIIPQIKTIIEPVVNDNPLPKNDKWQIVPDLEQYFAGIKLPSYPIKIDESRTILNVPQFIESHFETVKANKGNRIFLPYLDRLQELKQILN